MSHGRNSHPPFFVRGLFEAKYFSVKLAQPIPYFALIWSWS
jgi:hypothetical protein